MSRKKNMARPPKDAHKCPHKKALSVKRHKQKIVSKRALWDAKGERRSNHNQAYTRLYT